MILNRVEAKLKEVSGKMLTKVQSILQKPEVRQEVKEQVKEKARESIKDKLTRGKARADEENRKRWEQICCVGNDGNKYVVDIVI